MLCLPTRWQEFLGRILSAVRHIWTGASVRLLKQTRRDAKILALTQSKPFYQTGGASRHLPHAHLFQPQTSHLLCSFLWGFCILCLLCLELPQQTHHCHQMTPAHPEGPPSDISTSREASSAAHPEFRAPHPAPRPRGLHSSVLIR